MFSSKARCQLGCPKLSKAWRTVGVTRANGQQEVAVMGEGLNLQSYLGWVDAENEAALLT